MDMKTFPRSENKRYDKQGFRRMRFLEKIFENARSTSDEGLIMLFVIERKQNR